VWFVSRLLIKILLKAIVLYTFLVRTIVQDSRGFLNSVHTYEWSNFISSETILFFSSNNLFRISLSTGLKSDRVMSLSFMPLLLLTNHLT